MKTKIVILLLLFLIYICAEDQLNNENIQNQSTENKNQHESQIDRPFILTYDLETYKNGEFGNTYEREKTRQIIEKALKVVKKFLTDLLRVEVKTEDFYDVDEQEGSAIYDVIGSDLHILFYATNRSREDSYLKYQQLRNRRFFTFYSIRQKNNIPTHMGIEFNTYSKEFDHYEDDEALYIIIQNEIISAILLTFFKTVNIEENPELEINEYVHSNLKEMAVQHFNCDKLIGFPVITQPLYKHNHLKSESFENEISSFKKNKRQQPFLSKFTIALLKSTNLFTYINESMTEDYTYGKDAGCEIFKSSIEDVRRIREIPKTQLNFTYDKFSDFRSEYTQEYLADGVVATKILYTMQQFQHKCDHVSNQLIVKVSSTNDYDICNYNNQLIYYHDESCDCTRGFLCPENIKEFCSFKKTCANSYCSENGYCNNGVCNCIANYSGDGCEIYTGPIDNTPPIEETSPIENENESGEENTEQPSDP